MTRSPWSVVRSRIVPLLGLCVTLWAAPASGQAVRGVVFHPDSTTRAPGIVVVAADERGDAVARALSGPDGAFDLRVPGAGAYVLRLLRVGFRPTVLPAITVPPEGVNGIRAVLNAEAVVLAAVTVRSDNVCGTTEDAGRVVAQLWEEARTALSAAELSVGARSLEAEWQAFQFLMDRGAKRAQEQSVLPRSGVTERPFVSAGAEALASDGYVVDAGRDQLYRAPDAAALLSNQFAATHCFRVQPPTLVRPQWIGVAFRPTPARARLHDIMGTLWLDRATSELRLLEFRYTNLPRETDDPLIGGYVEYVRFTTGHWMVARWAIRTPRAVRRTIGGAAIPGGGSQDRAVMTGIGVQGGELIRVRRGTDVLYQAETELVAGEGSSSTAPAQPSSCGAALRPGVTITGVVMDSGARAGGAAVAVSWSPGGALAPVTLATVADLKGVFILPCVAPATPLTIQAARGDAKSGPMALAPLARASTMLEIVIRPPPGPQR